MRIVKLWVIFACLLPIFPAQAQTKPKSGRPEGLSVAELEGFMEGDYIIVGKKADSRATYSGRLTLHQRGTKLDFTRTVSGRTVRGTALFDTVAGGDRIPVLRMRFSMRGNAYEGTYQWANDYDNYLRFTGYVYRQDGKTKTVGLEMLFPLPPTIRD